MIKKLFYAFSLLLLFSGVEAFYITPVDVEAVLEAPTTINPADSFGLKLGVRNPRTLQDVGLSAFNIFSHYIYPADIEFIATGDASCAKLPNLNQVVCALYTLQDGQVKPSELATTIRPSFKLANPDSFCAGVNGPKALNLGKLTVASFNSKNITDVDNKVVSVNCTAGSSGASGADVDLALRYIGGTPINRVNSYEPFSVRLEAYNNDAAQVDIFTVQAQLIYPSVFEPVPASLAANNCVLGVNNTLVCDYFTLRPSKRKDIAFRLKSDVPCSTLTGTYGFKASASFNPTVPSQQRHEVNAANNTNIQSNSVTVTCENVPDVRFILLDASHIDLTDPNGLTGSGAPGRYSGQLRYRMEVNNPYNQALDIGDLEFNLNFGEETSNNSLTYRVLMSSASDGCNANAAGISANRITCSFNSIAAKTKIIKDLTLDIQFPNPVSDRTPFNPIAVCNGRMQVKSVSQAKINTLDGLKGWSDPVGDTTFYSNVDTRVIPGLNCINQTYTP